MSTYLAVFRIFIAARGLILFTEFLIEVKLLGWLSLSFPLTSTFSGFLKTTFLT